MARVFLLSPANCSGTRATDDVAAGGVITPNSGLRAADVP